MKIKMIIFSVLAITAAAIVSCSQQKALIGTKENPIRFFFMPLKNSEVFTKNAPIIQKFLQENSDLYIKPVEAKDFISIVKAFDTGRADAAFMNTLGYLLARDKSKTEAHLLMLYGDVYKTYRGEILALADGPISSPTDLAGKTIAFSDPFSASGYLYALKFLNDHNIKPAKTVFAGSHKKAVEMVYKGEVQAAATYHTRPAATGDERDSRSEVLKEFPDVISKIKIIALTDEIPNGPIALRADLPASVKTKLVGSLVEFARTSEGRKVLNDLYNVTGLALVYDADYNGVQKVIKDLGKSAEETVPGGITYYRMNIGPILEN